MVHVVSLAHLTLLDLTPPDLIAVAAAAGFDAVGLRLSSAGPDDRPYALSGDRQLMRETQQRMQETGVGVLDVEVMRLDEGTEVPAFQPVIEAAAELGARFLVVNGYGSGLQRMAEQFHVLCGLAEPAGLRPVLEFIPYSGVKSLTDALAVAGQSSGGILVDALHLSRSGATPADLAAVRPDQLPYVQLCDAPASPLGGDTDALRAESRYDRLPPGAGQLDLADFLARSIADHAPVSVEVPSRRLRAELGTRDFARLLRDSAAGVIQGPADIQPRRKTCRKTTTHP
jgi:sugar phosphate isomerase/epimerase